MVNKDSRSGEDRLQVSYSQIPGNPPSQDQMELKAKYITTAVIYYCNIALGVSATFMAPILIDFKNAFDTDMQTISIVFTISLVCMLVSATAFGIIFNFVSRHAIITFLQFVSAICLISLPFSNSITVFFVLNVLMAIGAGGYVTAQVVWVIEIWKEAAGPYIQAQHFFFAVGCIIPPLIFAPFLSTSNTPESITITNDNSSLLIDSQLASTSKISLSDTSDSERSTANLIIPCAICGSIVGIGAVLLLSILFAFKKENQSGYDAKTNSSDGESKLQAEDPLRKSTLVDIKLSDAEAIDVSSNSNTEPVKKESNVCGRLILIALSAAFVGSFQSMEAITVQFLPSFAHFSNLHLSLAVGSQVLSAYTIAYTVGRLAGIFIILKIAPQFILCGNFVFVVIANLVFLIWGMDSETFMWVGSVLLGIGYSTSVPSIFAYIQAHLEITNIVGAVLMVCGGCISSVFPIIVGTLIERMPAIVMFINFACAAVGASAFVGLVFVTKKKSD